MEVESFQNRIHSEEFYPDNKICNPGPRLRQGQVKIRERSRTEERTSLRLWCQDVRNTTVCRRRGVQEPASISTRYHKPSPSHPTKISNIVEQSQDPHILHLFRWTLLRNIKYPKKKVGKVSSEAQNSLSSPSC